MCSNTFAHSPVPFLPRPDPMVCINILQLQYIAIGQYKLFIASPLRLQLFIASPRRLQLFIAPSQCIVI
jgi:hypothetical protein